MGLLSGLISNRVLAVCPPLVTLAASFPISSYTVPPNVQNNEDEPDPHDVLLPNILAQLDRERVVDGNAHATNWWRRKLKWLVGYPWDCASLGSQGKFDRIVCCHRLLSMSLLPRSPSSRVPPRSPPAWCICVGPGCSKKKHAERYETGSCKWSFPNRVLDGKTAARSSKNGLGLLSMVPHVDVRESRESSRGGTSCPPMDLRYHTQCGKDRHANQHFRILWSASIVCNKVNS